LCLVAIDDILFDAGKTKTGYVSGRKTQFLKQTRDLRSGTQTKVTVRMS